MLRAASQIRPRGPRASPRWPTAARAEPQRAFVSASLRPYLLASLLDAEPDRPALVVAGDDRAARDLAADLKAFLAPRPVRFYPARGMRYESHLAPPPHLVGLRDRRARRALAERPQPAVLVAAAAALAEKVPDPDLRPHGFEIEKGGLLDLDETAGQLVACGYERVDQVEDRGQFAIRGDILDVYPATEERAVRCELFDVEVERLTWFSTFTQRSLEEAERVEIAPAAELGPEHRELAEIAAEQRGRRAPRRGRRAAGRPLPRAARPGARGRARGGRRRGGAAAGAARPLGGRHGELPRPGRPPPLRPARPPRPSALDAPRGAARCRASRPTSRTSSAPRAPTPPRARCARPSRSSRSWCARGYRTIVTWARRGEAERAQLNLARVQAAFLDGQPAPAEPSVLFAARGPARGLPGPAAQARDRARSTGCCAAAARAAPRGPAHAARSPPSPTCAPARRWCTRTTASRASPASRPRPSAASRATTSSSSSATATASSCRATSSTRSAATSAPTPATRSSRSSAASSGSSRSCAPAGRPRRSRAS